MYTTRHFYGTFLVVNGFVGFIYGVCIFIAGLVLSMGAPTISIGNISEHTIFVAGILICLYSIHYIVSSVCLISVGDLVRNYDEQLAKRDECSKELGARLNDLNEKLLKFQNNINEDSKTATSNK